MSQAASLDQLLIFSSRSGNVALVKERLAAGADPNHHDEQHGAALLQAIRCHHEGIVHILLSSGANPNMTDPQGNGPLEHALVGIDDPITLLLLSKGAQLKQHALPNYTDLLAACLKRNGR